MKILFLSESISLAHMARPLQLAKIAHQNGHDVHFACHSGNLEKAEKSRLPFCVYPLNTIESSVFFRRVFKSHFPYLLRELQAYLQVDMALIDKIKPDLIVNDFRLTAYIAGRKANTPVVQITNSYWHPSADCPMLPAPSSSAHLMGKSLFKFMSSFIFKLYGMPYRRLLKMMQLPAVHDFREFYTGGDYTAYMDIPHFVKNVETQSRYKIVGPILWQPDVSGSELGEYPQSGNVYVTLGGSGKSSYLKRILQALEHTGKFLILSGISDKLKQELLERHPFLEHKSIIRNLVNPEEFLHTCDLTICHGGSGTVYQSLNRGVPVFCFPSHSDQQLVSYHAKQHGVCEYIYAPRPSLANVKNILMKMLHKDSYKKNAILFADKIKTCDTASNWLNLLCEIEEKTARSSKAMPSIVLRQESYKSRSGVSLVLDN